MFVYTGEVFGQQIIVGTGIKSHISCFIDQSQKAGLAESYIEEPYFQENFMHSLHEYDMSEPSRSFLYLIQIVTVYSN